MSAKPISNRSLPPGGVVGTIHSPGALGAARSLAPGTVDYLELRVDAFAADAQALETLWSATPSLPARRLLTVRRPDEGGANLLRPARRRALYERWLPHAALVDLELRSVRELAPVVTAVQQAGLPLILSYHDFEATPSLRRLKTLYRRATQAGADVFKVATTAHTPADLAVLATFLATGGTEGGPALAVMGMKRYGMISRLTLGSTGSVLNYGYLDQLQVPGQWPAEELKKRLLELLPA